MSRAFDRLRRMTTRYIDRPLLALPLPIAAQRTLFEISARLNARPAAASVVWEDVAGIRTRVSRPAEARGRLLWLHGGGFIIGSPQTHAAFADRMAQETGLEVWLPDYRLAPENPFPAAPDDCTAVARAMPGPFHLAGDSAGGNLALVVLQDMLAREKPPLSVTLISPAVDLREGRDAPECDEMLMPAAFLTRCRAAYVAGADARDPRLSPILGRYPNAPPVHIELSSREVLERDGQAIARRLREDGARVSTFVEHGVPHVYHLAVGRSAAAEAALLRLKKVLT
ncbi:alpha/beta hydrolase [Jannaschia sp. M317]|uniref:alpha/beta hydrolase n=1 Tax=Jannaschia sp. M317 TaxID=2867011 RepID=UPI0021A2780B|nr:alpha/beta hydrolase [Jannaschia sp. M317]UWQ16488.1 alpha/beta hydrolase [Jannaschia sp. M317]